VEVEPLHQDPGVVCHDAVLPHAGYCLAQPVILERSAVSE
jgi:hypothetical protein